MLIKQANKSDPRNVMVQVSIRLPFWYKEQLAQLAHDNGVTLSVFVAQMVQRQIRPEPPKD